MRWLWIDRFVDFQPGRSARAVKNVSLAEDYFAVHFPGYPVMPASLMLEGLAQTGGILVGHARNFQEKVILAKIPKARFACEVFAGMILTYVTEIQDLRPEGAFVLGQIFVEEHPIGEAEIYFAHLDQARGQSWSDSGNFVFTGELQRILGLSRLLNAPDPAP